MLNEQNDSYLLYMNGKPVAIAPDLEAAKKLAEAVAVQRPDADLVIRVADRLRSEAGPPIVDPDAKTWTFDRMRKSWDAKL